MSFGDFQLACSASLYQAFSCCSLSAWVDQKSRRVCFAITLTSLRYNPNTKRKVTDMVTSNKKFYFKYPLALYLTHLIIKLRRTKQPKLLTHHPVHHLFKHTGLGKFIQVKIHNFHLPEQTGLGFVVAVYFVEEGALRLV